MPKKRGKWAVAAFAGLAISSLIQAFAGKCSCGCFGAIAVNPWSAAVFDLGAIALLLLSWPRATSGATTTRSRWLYVGLVSFSLVVTAGGWSQSTTVSLAGKATRGDRPVQETTLTFTGDSGRIVVRHGSRRPLPAAFGPPGPLRRFHTRKNKYINTNP